MTGADGVGDIGDDMNDQSIIEELVVDSCTALFADYSVSLERVADADLGAASLLYCGVIGFSGDQLRGSMLLATTAAALARSNPVPGNPDREWIAELTNQLLGRVKTQLMRRGVTIYMSTPVVLRGQHIAPLPSHELRPLAFRYEQDRVCVWFDIESAPEFQLGEVAPEAGTALDEGTGMLF